MPDFSRSRIRAHLVMIAAVSFVTLALELHLTRVLAYVFWNHVVYLIVSLALLGYGAASTFVSLIEKRLKKEDVGPRFLCLNVVLAAFCVTGLLLWLSQVQMSFQIDKILTSLPHLLVAYSIVSLTFFFCGNIVVYLFFVNPQDAPRLYTWDLSAAALACALFPFTLPYLGGVRTPLLVCGGLTLLSAATIVTSANRQRHRVLLVIATVLGIALLAFASVAESVVKLTPDRSKSLGRAMDKGVNPGVRVEHTSWDLVTRLDVVSGEGPINIGWYTVPSSTKLITFDGDAISQISPHPTTFPTSEEKQAFLAQDFHAPFFRSVIGGSHLIIGLGGGPDIAQSLLLDARTITAVDINGAIIQAMTGPFAGYSGNLFTRPNVSLHHAEGRAFLKSSDKTFELIQMTGVDTFTALSTGAYVMAENHLYTVEAIQDYFRHLSPGGVLCIHRWFYDQRPRETLRLFAVMLEALRREGLARPWEHIAVVRPAVSGVTILRKTAFSSTEAPSVFQEASARGAVPVYMPHTEPSQHPASRIFHSYVAAFGRSQETAFQRAYPYDISPVDDDRPFFFNYYKLSRMFTETGTGPIQGYWAYFVFAVILLLAILAVFVIIWLPLLVWRRAGLRAPFALAGAVYFACLGVGFIMIEIALMQRFALFLGHPSYSIAVIMGAMLSAAGAGSSIAARIATPRRRVLVGAIGVAAICLLFSTSALPAILQAAVGLPVVVKVLIACALVMPLAGLLGAFFPAGLQTIGASHPEFVPWAWGINSGFTVIGSVVAVMLAMWLGFSQVIMVAAAIYLLTPPFLRLLETRARG